MIDGLKTVPMQENHVDDVVRLEAQTSATPWSASVFISELSSPTHILLVACINSELHPRTDKVVGFAGGQIVSDELHVHSLAVDENYRRNGIGEGLIMSLVNSAIVRDALSATLEVRVGNSIAISLYEKLGFKSEGIRHKYYSDNGEDANIMWLHDFKEISKATL